nr:unnamed protein product [Digitaria exilis]
MAATCAEMAAADEEEVGEVGTMGRKRRSSGGRSARCGTRRVASISRAMAATCAEMAAADEEEVGEVGTMGVRVRGERKARRARRLVEKRERRTRRLSSAGEQRHARPRRPPRRDDATFRDTDPMARRPGGRRVG